MKKTDYCTMSPDTIWGTYIGDVCKQHDEDYTTHQVTRAEADKYLRWGIQAKGLYWTGWLYWLGVRLFGWIAWR